MINMIRTVGELKSFIKDLDDDMSIECNVHKLSNTYILGDVYVCGNSVGEVILQLGIKTDWDLTERDEKAFKEWCKQQDENGDDEND